MKLASILINDSMDRQTRTVIVDPEQMLCWPIENASVVSAISDLTKGCTPKIDPQRGVGFKREQLLAPLSTPPHNIMCVGKNYRAHAREFHRSGFDATADSDIPAEPIIFTKPSSSISGPYADIPLWPGIDESVDYEAELAIIIGRGGRMISRESAMDHVFGYTIVNDVTARDLQRKHKQWFLGKAIDGFCPMGPWIVSKDEINLDATRVTCRVNGELRQSAITADLIFDIATLIEKISISVTLAPGDVISTGTPEGVGIGFDPPRFLKDGDVVECAIEGIGSIVNRVRQIKKTEKQANA
jgi:2-keto-4-pentenoate hydratase/2-oxohepta-3-ene-1,7-dioic acid hydratase in catechol pathway